MIDRRTFVRTLSTAAVGLGATRLAHGARRRAVGRGLDTFRSHEGQLVADLRASETSVPLAGRSAQLYAFNGRVPGPLFEARAGDDATIRFTNALSEPTNLHFHGLHVPPTGTADNIFLHVPPGEAFTYRFALPHDHTAGMFWIHPHHHGMVARQVSRGLAAPLIVRGDIDDVPEVAAAEEHVLLLQDFELDGDGDVVEPLPGSLMAGREGSLVTLGGAMNPTIPIRAGGLLRLRLVNASASRFYGLRIEDHPMHVIGIDGCSLPETRTMDSILFVPGQRLDILVHGTRGGGSFRLLNLPYDRGSNATGGTTQVRTPITDDADTLATIEYRGQSDRVWTIPDRLAGTIDALPAPTTTPRVFRLGQGMMAGTGMGFTINGRTFDENRIDAQTRLGTIEEWVFANDTPMDHPMHLHTNAFQVVGSDGAAERVWRDIVLVRGTSHAKVRVRFADFEGKTVQHCHILDHEDLGMMATVDMRA